MFTKSEIIEAHKFSYGNKSNLLKYSKCGCFYCLKIFDPKEIIDWVGDEKGFTAICPYCNIDSVIGEGAGYPITEDFLKAMHNHCF